MAVYQEEENDGLFAESNGVTLLSSGQLSQGTILSENDRDSNNVGKPSLEDENDRATSVQTVTSVGDSEKPGPPMRKLDQVLGAVCDVGTENVKM